MLKLNGASALESAGHTDLGALRFHGVEAAKAGGRAAQAGYRRAKPHVERAARGAKAAAEEGYRRAKPHVAKAAAYTWEGAKEGSRRAAAAVRQWRAKPNDARFADAPAGARFAEFEPLPERRFIVHSYHPSLAAARESVRSNTARHIVELPRARGAKDNKSLAAHFRDWTGAGDAAASPSHDLQRANVAAILRALASPSPATATVRRLAEVELSADRAAGAYQRRRALRLYEPVVIAAVKDYRRHESPGDRRFFQPHDLEEAALRLALAFEQGDGRPASKANDRRRAEAPPGQLALGLSLGHGPARAPAPTFAPPSAAALAEGRRREAERQRALTEAEDEHQARRRTAWDSRRADELLLVMTNDGPFYFGKIRPVETALARKYKAGQYIHESAVRAYEPVVRDGVKLFRRTEEPGERMAFSEEDRYAVAMALARHFEVEGHGQHWLNDSRGAKPNGRPPPVDQLPLGFGAPPPVQGPDPMVLHDLFSYGRQASIPTTEVQLPYQTDAIRKALVTGLVVAVGDRLDLTVAGRDVVARENARLDAQSRAEEAQMGAAMRRGMEREEREYWARSPSRPAARAAAPKPPKAPKRAAGEPTDLNLWVLSERFQNTDSVSNRLEATDIPHLRRCLKAGLIVATREKLTLTDKGRAELAQYRARQPRSAKPNHHGGAHAAGDPLAMYLPPLSDRGQWLSLGKTSGIYWNHPALFWEFRIYGPEHWNPEARGTGEVRVGHSYDAPKLAQFVGDPASVYEQMVRWYATLTHADVTRVRGSATRNSAALRSWGIFPRDGGGYLSTFDAPSAEGAMAQWADRETASDRRFPRSYFLEQYVARPITR